MNVLTTLDRYLTHILPVRLWDGTNRYCSQPGREGSEYLTDITELHRARVATWRLIDAASAVMDAPASLDLLKLQRGERAVTLSLTVEEMQKLSNALAAAKGGDA